jgi:DeoR/GlpR family transcriptional regulator of sugar metabolism
VQYFCKYLQVILKTTIFTLFSLLFSEKKTKMLKEERQQLILEHLKTAKKINLGDLSNMLTVSYDSVRRDVIELEDKGLLKKVHGGVVSNSYLNILSGQRKDVKKGGDLEIVIKKAVKFLKNNQIIILDGGTTNFFLAEQIPKNLTLTVITNSPPLAMALNDHENVEVILLGGRYYKRYQIAMGPEVSNQLKRFNADIYFMGVNGIDKTKGLTIRNYEESILKQQMMAAAKNTICCVVEEKIGVLEAYQICPLEKINTLITNIEPNSISLLGFEGVEKV